MRGLLSFSFSSRRVRESVLLLSKSRDEENDAVKVSRTRDNEVKRMEASNLKAVSTIELDSITPCKTSRLGLLFS